MQKEHLIVVLVGIVAISAMVAMVIKAGSGSVSLPSESTSGNAYSIDGSCNTKISGDTLITTCGLCRISCNRALHTCTQSIAC